MKKWPSYLAIMPPFLFKTDSNVARYIIRSWLLSLCGSLVLAIIAERLLPSTHAMPPRSVENPAVIISMVLIAPVVETVIMAGILLLLLTVLGPGPAVVISAIGWGAAHSIVATKMVLITWWSFLIFSIAFVTWSRAIGSIRAVLIAIAVHALDNSFVAVILLIVHLFKKNGTYL
jgi:hypothetical protein